MSGPRPFMDFLRDQRRGQTHDELSAKLNELVAAVSETGKAGKMILEIVVKPASKDAPHLTDMAVIVTDKVVLKAPEIERSPSVFFVTPENNLSKTDPTQTSLELKVAAGTDVGSDLKDAPVADNTAALRVVG